MQRHERVVDKEENKTNQLDVSQLNFNVKEIEEVTTKEANRKFQQNLPILSAASHLSISDCKKAL